MINKGVTPEGRHYQECDECSQGIHRHMDALANSPEWFADQSVDKSQKIDELDCKNILDANNQCICRKYIEWHDRILYSEKWRKVVESFGKGR